MATKIPQRHTMSDADYALAQAAYDAHWEYFADPTEGFIRFLREAVYTSDEEARTDQGEEARKKFPVDKTYVEHFIRYGLNMERLIVMPKSRRMMATWVVAAYALWTAMFKHKRNVIWQAQNGAKSANTLEKKMVYILENLPQDLIAPFVEIKADVATLPKGWDSRLVNYWRGRRDAAGLVEIGFIRKEYRSTGEAFFTDDSVIRGVAEGEHQWRQFTVSLGVLDEFAFFTKPHDSIKGARPAVGMNGQLIAISSANPGYMKEMIERPDETERGQLGISWMNRTNPEHRGVTQWTSKHGYAVYRLHYTADDAKDNPEWTMWGGDDPTNPRAGLARRGYDKRQWDQEMEIDFSVHQGMPFYPEWQDHLHLNALMPMPGVPIVLGFDFGLTPATVICQVSPSGHLLVLDEVVSFENGIYQHANDLIVLLDNKYKWWRGGQERRRDEMDFLLEAEEVTGKYAGMKMLTSYVDPAGVIRSQTDMRSPVDILRDMGLNPTPSTQDPVLRMESVKKALRSLAPYKDRSLPAILVDPNCKVLIEGLRGGAKVGTTRFSKDKNNFSHVVEALEYVTVKLFAPTGRDPITGQYKQKVDSRPYIPKRERW